MKKLDVVGKSLIVVGGFIIIIFAVYYLQGLQIMDDEKKGTYCTKPGQNCPLPSMSTFVFNLQIGVLVTCVGIGFIVTSKYYKF